MIVGQVADSTLHKIRGESPCEQVLLQRAHDVKEREGVGGRKRQKESTVLHSESHLKSWPAG